VVEVRGEHLSRGRIIYLDDLLASGERRHNRTRNPVLVGDVLVNPSWSAGAPKHVALAGAVDLTGEGRDNTEEFVRALQRQNIVVDSYLNLRDLSDDAIDAALKKVSVQTDYLVVGDVPPYLRESRDKDAKGDKLQEAINKMKEAAKQNGVRIIGLRKYLELIGYETPRALTGDESTSSFYRSTVTPKPDAPKPDAPKPDAPKKDDMMKDAKPPM
jgi:hypothetical protein